MQRAASSAASRLGAATQPPAAEALSAFVQALPLPAAVLGAHRTTVAWNGAAESTFGWRAAEVVGGRLPLLSGGGAAELRLLLQGVLHGHAPMRLELEVRRRDRTRMNVRVTGSSLRPLTSAAQVLLLFEDLTARDQLRRRVHRSERHARSVAELSPEATLILQAGVVVYGNPACLKLLGTTRGRLLGSDFSAFVAGSQDEIGRIVAEKPTRNAAVMVEARLRRADGAELEVEAVVTPFRFRTRPALLLLVRDITARRATEAELQRSQERFRFLSESLRDHAIVALDPQGRIVSWNVGAERLFGHPAAHAIGADSSLLFRDEDVASGRPVMELRTTLELGRFEVEEWRRRADGAEFWAAVTIAPQYTAEDRLIGYALTVRDLTERRAAQEALRRTEDQLRHAQRMEAVGRLAAGVAHDFNNLLTAVRGYARLLLDDMGSDPRAADVQEIYRAAERGSTLTRQLLAIGRRQVMEPGVLDLNEIVREAMKLLQRVLDGGVVLETRLESGLGSVHADPSQVEQVLLNLVVNARDAMPDGGRITIETRNEPATPESPDGRVVLSVSDTGVGMDHETQGKIFEPFFTTKPPGKGSGLGLSTAYGIIRQSGGSIQVHSSLGAGSTFEVALPRYREPPAPEKHPVTTVLVALRDAAARALARRTLEQRGHGVIEAGSFAEAMRAARACPGQIDLLVAEATIKGPGGRALVESLAGACGALGVVVVAERADPRPVPSLSGRRMAVITQPLTPLALARSVRVLLGGGVAT